MFQSAVGGYLNGTVYYVDILDGTAMASLVPVPVAQDGYVFEGWAPALPETVTESAVYVAQFSTSYDMPIDLTEAIYDPETGKLTVKGLAENAEDQWNIALFVYANVDDVAGITADPVITTYTNTFGAMKTEGDEFVASFDTYEAGLTGNVYVYGKYVEVESTADVERVKTYLYFDKNASDAVDGATTETLVYINDEIIPSLTTDEPTREGYDFVAWRADAEGTEIAAGTLMTAAGYTAYAEWIAHDVEVSYEFSYSEEWYIVNEKLDATTYELYRVYGDGTKVLIDPALYSVEALPTTDDSTYAECLGWHELAVVFDDAAYGNVYTDSMTAFVIPDKLILEEESPLDRVAPTREGIGLDYSDMVLDSLDCDLIINMMAKQDDKTLIDEFINMYFINAFTDPDSIDYEVRVVTADRAEWDDFNWVGTGVRVQLVIEGVVYDEVQVVVLGDTNGDGDITGADSNVISNYRKGYIELTGVYYIAANTNSGNGHTDLTGADINAISNYRKGYIELFDAWKNASHVYSRDYSALYAVTKP